MDLPAAGDDTSAAAWDWGSLLDFSIDDHDLSWTVSEATLLPSAEPDPEPVPSPAPPPPAPTSSRVRKRDPRLVCENYLAGRVPCACPEIDEKEKELEEDDAKAEAAAGGRKRSRAGGAGSVLRCQVVGCEADIMELKGYHRRHRVCLQCANAPSVLVDGEEKRYCQQCGKFHILPDFDEGKRSCRRKLERHNKRRRRRPTGSRNLVEKEHDPQRDWSANTSCDREPMKDTSNEFVSETVETVVSNKKTDIETLLESEDGPGSPICLPPGFQNVQSANNVPFAASDGNRLEERTDNAKSSFSSTLCDNKSVYSSVCPTGRISFKLYDWNPAEFPRRLRHQIFQWLASMPVELEGYIRPGCTILTVFIAMPQFMWDMLHEDVTLYVQNLIDAPESLFSGRGNFLMYLSNKIVHILKDGTTLMNVKMEVKVPRLHYVYPNFFEAGKPMQFFACGSNLDQPKFRFLVSFAGKYLIYDACHAISHGNIKSYNGNGGDSSESSEHEMFRISIAGTSSEVFGPAFVEIENESGLSNFLPILVGNKHICSDLERLQSRCSVALSVNNMASQIPVSCSSMGFCESFVSKQAAISELVVDIAWLLKDPGLDANESILSSSNIKRLACLLKFSLDNELVSVLEAIQQYFENMAGRTGLDTSVDMFPIADLDILLKYMSHAREYLDMRTSHDLPSELHSRDSIHRLPLVHSYLKSERICTVPQANQDVEPRSRDSLVSANASSRQVDEENIPLTNGQITRRQKCYPNLRVQEEGWPKIFPWKVATGARLSVFIMVSVVMCFAACVALLHPHKARDFAVTIRTGLFGEP